ncbi:MULTISPECIES: hypothetical protein [unclassified Pseudarthrobacter]|uniref:hypothetical protein n=1 Tax=unclassified Pseudarthrobacter TaxID=2647000 RepID=UPI003077760F
MVAGGLLWIVHGYFRFVMPYGPDAVWREDLNYSPIISTELFLLYNAPGVLALLLSAWTALSYLRGLPRTRPGFQRAAQILATLAILFGLVAAIGVAVLFVPPTTGGISFGVPSLGLALAMAGLAVGSDGNRKGQSRLLVFTGLLGMFTLPVQPLMYALALLPMAVGTAVFAVFGAGWVALAFILSSEPRGRGREANVPASEGAP